MEGGGLLCMNLLGVVLLGNIYIGGEREGEREKERERLRRGKGGGNE